MFKVTTSTFNSFFFISLIFFSLLSLYLAFVLKTDERYSFDRYIQLVEDISSIETSEEKVRGEEFEPHPSQLKNIYEGITDRFSSMKKTSRSYEISFEEVEKNFKGFKTSYEPFISLPSYSDLLKAYGKNFDKFYKFVLKNRWLTLTAISKKISFHIRELSRQGIGSSSAQKLNSTIKKIKRNLNQIVLVTKQSNLREGQKSLILTKTIPLEEGTEKISSYLNRSFKFFSKSEAVTKSMKRWSSEILPPLKKDQYEFYRSSNNYFNYLLGFSVLCLILCLLGWGLLSWEQRKNKRLIEGKIVDLIKNYILKQRFSRTKELGGSQFTENIKALHEYSQKRMNLGKVLNMSCPFPMFSMDENFNITWSNTHFKNLFTSNESEDVDITWDYFRQRTNLGEGDPMNSAIKENIAGIYQIQLKTAHDENPLPFEIYVCPLEDYKNQRIVVWFYPLQSLQDTLVDQARSIVGPVGRMLDALLENGYDQNFQNSIKNDFFVAGIGGLHRKLDTYIEREQEEKNSLLDQMEIQQDLLGTVRDNVDHIKNIIKELDSQNKKTFKEIISVKDKFLKIISLSEKLEEIQKKTFQKEKSFFPFLEDYQKQMTSLQDFTRSMMKLELPFRDLKETSKSLSENFADLKLQLKKGGARSDWGERFNVIEGIVAKNQKSYDLLLSKFEILSGNRPPEPQNESIKRWRGLEEDLKMFSTDFQAVISSIFDTAEGTIDSFQKVSIEMNRIFKVNQQTLIIDENQKRP